MAEVAAEAKMKRDWPPPPPATLWWAVLGALWCTFLVQLGVNLVENYLQ